MSESLPNTATFQSLLPILDDLLLNIHNQSISTTPPSAVEAAESVTVLAKQLRDTLNGMINLTTSLPGGGTSLDQIQEITRVLEGEAEKRRNVLRRFGEREMGTVERIAAAGAGAVEEGEGGVEGVENGGRL